MKGSTVHRAAVRRCSGRDDHRVYHFGSPAISRVRILTHSNERMSLMTQNHPRHDLYHWNHRMGDTARCRCDQHGSILSLVALLWLRVRRCTRIRYDSAAIELGQR